ncbi:LamG-like jellyroll fold domain-containing protein, partial [Candidatus Sumerlaeota bacterium]
FPAVTLAAGEHLVVFASGKNRAIAGSELHTDFKLSGDGEYLAIVQPDGTTIDYEYAPPFLPQQDDISFGLTFVSTDLILAGDNVEILVPADGALGATWTGDAFSTGGLWTFGPTGVGFKSTPVTGATLLVDLDAEGLALGPLATWPNAGSMSDFGAQGTDPTVAIVDGVRAVTFDGNDFMRTSELAPAGITGTSNWSTEAWVHNPSLSNEEALVCWARRNGPCNYTAHMNYGSSGGSGAIVHWCADMGFTVQPAPGEWHHLVVTYEGGTDGAQKIYVDGELDNQAPRTLNLHGPSGTEGISVLLGGTTTNTGINVTPNGTWLTGSLAQVRIHDGELTAAQVKDNFLAHAGRFGVPSAVTSLMATDLEAEMMGVNPSVYLRVPFAVIDPSALDLLELRMQYMDGFVAYINGTEVARRNAPASPAWDSAATATRTDDQAMAAEIINVSAALPLLQAGNNVLAIHGLNDDVNDGSCLILPELIGSALAPGPPGYFEPATPGAINGSSFIGFVGDTKFSVDRGFYETPFTVEITTTGTVGAYIRYTLDGSEPTEANGTDCTVPISITGTSCLRARAFVTGYQPSNVDTHTYIFVSDVITQSLAGQAPTPDWPPSGWFNGQWMVYGMDPDVVNDARYTDKMTSAMLGISSMSFVTDLDNMFGVTDGIYANSIQRGRLWERPLSVEVLNPDGSEGFQVEAGVRIRGAASRGGGNPKHGFRLFFREEYGDAKLNFPLFGDEGEDSFDKVDVRCEQNYSWSKDGDPWAWDNTLIKDVFSRDLQREMGQPYTRSRYYHLFINGHYWGIYQTQERAEARYAETYFGGDKDDYDVMKAENVWPRKVTVTDGNMDAFTRLWTAAVAGFASNADYYSIQGLNPDGTRNPAYERLVDVNNVIDYELDTFYVGDFDGPICAWYGNGCMNNVYMVYNRSNPDGFKFFRHDAEHSILSHRAGDAGAPGIYSSSIDRTGLWNTGQLLEDFNPQYLHQQLAGNQAYLMRFADRVRKHFYHDGILSPTNAAALFASRQAELDLAVIGESARWGDTHIHPPRTKDDDWLPCINDIYARFFPGRTNQVIAQLRAKGWYPNTDPPDFSINGTPQHGGPITAGDALTMTAPMGAIY